MSIQADQQHQLSPASRRLTRTTGVAASVVAAVIVWVVGEPLLGHDLVIEQPGQDPMDLGVIEIATISLAASLLGWALLAILERLTPRAGSIWTIVAAAVVVVSFLPFIQVEATTGTKVVLALTHVAVAAVLIPSFRRTTGGGNLATTIQGEDE